MAEFTIGAPIAYFTGLLAFHSRCDNMYTQPCPCDSVVPCPSTVDQCVHFALVNPPNSAQYVVLESGDHLLLESGDKVLLE